MDRHVYAVRAGRSLTIAAALLAVVCAAFVASAGAASGDCVGTTPVVCTYTATGSEQQFTVPAGVTSLHVVAIGGQGGQGDSGAVGGFGDRLEGDLAVTSGATLYVEVGGNGDGGSGATGGGGGFNGGAVGGNTGPCDFNGGGGGGGGSDIRTVAGTDGTALNSRLFSAGGGGGGGGFNSGAVGGNAGSPGTSATGGGGGGAGTSGGAAGGGGSGGGVNGGGGSLGTGGAGGFGSCDGGGGGAGGKYGGGGGGGNSDFQASGGGGGGGGSSDTGSLTGGSQATDNTGTPSITISYTVPLVSSASLSCHYNTGSTHNSDEFTNGGNSANVPHGTTQSYVVHCVVSTSGTVTKWKVQGGLTNSMKKAPSYSFLSDTCPHDTTHKIDTSKNGNVVTDAGTSLSSTCDIEVLVTGASWKATGLQNLTGSWSLSYKDSSGAGQSTQAPETPLQVQST